MKEMRQRLWNRSKLPSYTALCSHWYHKKNLHHKVITKLTFWAPALCQSEQRDWGLWVFNNNIIIVGGWGRWRRYAIGGKGVIFFSGLHSLRWSFSINVSLTLFIITITTTTSSPCYRGFNRSRQPVNFATYFPNHCWLLSMLNFIWVVTVITKSIFSTEFDARMQEMSLLGSYIPKFSGGACPKIPLGRGAL